MARKSYKPEVLFGALARRTTALISDLGEPIIHSYPGCENFCPPIGVHPPE